MKFNIWRIATIVLMCAMASLAWYLYELNESAESHLSQLKGEVIFLTSKITDFSVVKRTLKTKLGIYKEENEVLLGKMNEYESNIEQLEYEVEEIGKDLLTTKKTALDKGKKIDELKNKIEEYKTENTQLIEKLSLIAGKPWHEGASSSDVTLAPITIKPKKLKTKGKVLEVNKRYDFIVVNAGKRKGVREGDVLYIFRGRKMLARVSVERVGNDAAITKTLHKSMANINIKRGDKVRF
ncbi:MAG: hypothetical protein ISS92_06265 [Candidatus Omnitrophica bacterium]|nr:hypothetical protein [Candidatus Omnitrophota bacterium]